jgi:DNA polymerase III subunit gamma/tau
MAPEVVMQHLQQVLRAEGVASDAASLRLLSRAARGSMRDALSLTDQAIAYGAGRLEEAAVRAMLGTVDAGHAAACIDALARRDAPALLAQVQALREMGLSAEGTLESMAMLLQRMAVEQAVPGTLLAADDGDGDALRLAGAMPADETQLLYSIVLQGRGELALMSDEYGALTMVLLRALAFAPGAPSEQAAMAQPPSRAAAPRPAVAARSPAPVARMPDPPPWLDEAPPEDLAAPASGSAALRTAAAPAIAVAATPPAMEHSLAPTPLGDRWAGLVASLSERGALSALVRELAWQAGLDRIDDGTQPPTWHLLVERDSLRSDALRDKLGQLLAAELGQPLQLALHEQVPQDSPARRDAQRSAGGRSAVAVQGRAHRARFDQTPLTREGTRA